MPARAAHPRLPWRTPADVSAAVRQGDWLDFARSLEPASADLVYIDPPFNTGQTQTDRNGRFGDRWPTIDAYLAWLEERLAATVPLLKPTGNLLLHLDWRTSHHARLLLDRLLGPDRFVNHLVWSYGLGGSSPKRFARKHDDILFYCINPALSYFDPPRIPATSQRLKGQTKKATDVLEIPSINNMAAERTGYPTQKPLALLDLLVRACCPLGGLVLDPCCGSGTTLLAALNAGRRAAGCDANPDAVSIARERLNESQSPPDR